MKPRIEIFISHTSSNGDEGVTKVKKVSIPDYIKNHKLDKNSNYSLAEQKDIMMDDYVKDLAKNIKDGLEHINREQERNQYFDW